MSLGLTVPVPGRAFAVVAALLLGCAAAPAAEPTTDAAQPTIAHAPDDIAIDGQLDDDAWQAATPIPVVYIHGKKDAPVDSPHMIVRYLWDEHYLYIAYETFDANVTAFGQDDHQGPPDNQRQTAEIWIEGEKVDVVEFFITFSSTRFFWELHHNAANHFSDIFCTVFDKDWPINESSVADYGILFGRELLLVDDGEFTFASAAALKPRADGRPSTINDASDTDTGYTAELRIPWLALGAPKKARLWTDDKPRQATGAWDMVGQSIRILAAIQQGDGDIRYMHSSPTMGGGFFHHGAIDWPMYRLAE